MYYSTDYVLHKTKSVTVKPYCHVHMDKYSGSPLLRNSYKKLLGSTFWKTYQYECLSAIQYGAKFRFSVSQSLKIYQKA